MFFTHEQPLVGEPESYHREFGALFAIAAAGSITVSMLGGYNEAPAPAQNPAIVRYSPDTAREAIAGGMTCTLESAGPTDGHIKDWDNEDWTRVKLSIRFTQTPQSRAARAQYAAGDRVLWRPEDIETASFGFWDGVSHQLDEPAENIYGGKTMDPTVEVLVPAEDLNGGAKIEAASLQAVETGQGGNQSNLRVTVSRQVCGAFTLKRGHFVVVSPPVGHDSITTRAGSQAASFW